MRLLRRGARLSFSLLAVSAAMLATALLARLLLPYLPLPVPLVEATIPAPAAQNVSPLSRLTLRFSEPMNRASVARSLRVEPPLAYSLRWENGDRTLIVSPTAALDANTAYQLSLSAAATSRFYRPLQAPLSIGFRTALAPTVVSLLPADGAIVPRDGLLSVGFSQPMVPPDLLGRDLTLPELRVEPPVELAAHWLSQTTLLLRPRALLDPATPYTVTIDGGLRDLSGASLGQELYWRFSTAPPSVAAVAPLPLARNVGIRQPLLISTTAPLDPAAVAAALIITPSIQGTLDAAPLPAGLGASQVITFTPTDGWQPSATYTATLPAGIAPAIGTAPLSGSLSWSFQVAVLPRIVGRFPGVGQALPAGQEPRLVFSTPFDAQALLQALRIEPAVAGLAVRSSGNEARLSGPLRPATTYTVTLPAALADTNGVALGRDERFTFLTAPAAPSLLLPEVEGNVLTLQAGQEHRVALERVNLAGVELALYGLDEATLVRTLSFGPDDWRSFTPERYGRGELARRSLRFDETPNTPATDVLPLSLDDAQAGLAPGAYYLRVISAEGPRADLLVVVAQTVLALKHSPAEVLVWAADLADGSAVAELPLALYQGDTLLAKGQSDGSGLWRIPVQQVPGSQPYVAVTTAGPLAVVSSAWRVGADLAGAQLARQRPARYQGLLYTDRASYEPGELLLLRALVREISGGAARWPANDTPLLLSLRPSGGAVIARQPAVLRGGVVSTTLRLPADAAPGRYLLQGDVGNLRLETQIEVPSTAGGLLEVRLAAPPQAAAGTPLLLEARVATPEGWPLAGIATRWRLDCAAEAASANCTTLLGEGLTDDAGLLRFAPDLPPGARGPHRLSVEAEELPGITGTATTVVEVLPPLRIELATELLLVAAGEPVALRLTARDAAEQPLPGQSVTLLLLQETESGNGELLRLQVATGDDGALTLTLPGQQAGRYRVVAEGIDGEPLATSSLTVFAPGASYAATGSEVPLVADRASYQPGDTALLLPLLPTEIATGLLVRERQGALEAEVRELRAGEPVAIPITDQDAGGLLVSLLLLTSGDGQTALLPGYALLPVAPPAPLLVTITPERASYQPGETARLAVQITDGAGAGLAAPFALLATSDAPGLAADAVERVLGTLRTPGVLSAHNLARRAELPAQSIASIPDSDPLLPQRVDRLRQAVPSIWLPDLRSSTAGTATVEIQLPPTPGILRLAVIATAGAASWGQAAASLPITQPLLLEPLLPTVVGTDDEAQLLLRLTNTTPQRRAVTVTLAADGLVLGSDSPPSRELTLEPGTTALLGWNSSASSSRPATLRFSATAGAATLTATAALPVRIPATDVVSSGGGVAAPRFSTAPLALTPDAAVELLVAPSVQAALLDSWRHLDAQQPRSAATDAATLLAAGSLVRAGLLPTAAQQAPLERLLRAQRVDGAWGWWPTSQADQQISVQAALALGQSGLALPTSATEAATRYLRQELASSQPDQQAIILYALASLDRLDRPTAAALRAAPGQLSSSGLAALLLALDRDGQRQAAGLLADLLVGRATQQGNIAFWHDSDELVATALAAEALVRLARLPDQALLEQARHFLTGRYRIGGWGRQETTALAIVALAAPLPDQGQDYGYSLELSGVELLRRNVSTTMTATERLLLGPSDIRAGGELAASRSGEAGQLLVAYEVRATAAGQGRRALALQREFVDPQSGIPLDLAALHVGQLVEARLVLVTPTDLEQVVLTDPLAGNLALVRSSTQHSAFEYAHFTQGALQAYSSKVLAGVHEYHYLARIIAAGSFNAAPVTAHYNQLLQVAGQSIRLQLSSR